jgi:hypothetical protein
MVEISDIPGLKMETGGTQLIDEKKMQVLRLTTPKLHPKEHRPLFGDPGTEKRLGPLSLRMTAS